MASQGAEGGIRSHKLKDLEEQLEEVYDKLHAFVETDSFLAQLEEWKRVEKDPAEVLDRAFVHDFVFVEHESGEEGEDDFVLVSRDDAVEAMATFIAAYLSSLPEARAMESRKLQEALKSTLQALRRNRWRQVWTWGNCLYRCAALTYSAFAIYDNPWLVQATISALWTSSSLWWQGLL